MGALAPLRLRALMRAFAPLRLRALMRAFTPLRLRALTRAFAPLRALMPRAFAPLRRRALTRAFDPLRMRAWTGAATRTAAVPAAALGAVTAARTVAVPATALGAATAALTAAVPSTALGAATAAAITTTPGAATAAAPVGVHALPCARFISVPTPRQLRLYAPTGRWILDIFGIVPTIHLAAIPAAPAAAAALPFMDTPALSLAAAAAMRTATLPPRTGWSVSVLCGRRTDHIAHRPVMYRMVGR
jgi:hypothetical protein